MQSASHKTQSIFILDLSHCRTETFTTSASVNHKEEDIIRRFTRSSFVNKHRKKLQESYKL